MVLERWKAAKVFAPVVAALDRAGYEAELSGFEKLFVFNADESKIRPELEALGIRAAKSFLIREPLTLPSKPVGNAVSFALLSRRVNSAAT